MNCVNISPMSLEVQLYLANSKEYTFWRRYDKVIKKKAIND